MMQRVGSWRVSVLYNVRVTTSCYQWPVTLQRRSTPVRSIISWY